MIAARVGLVSVVFLAACGSPATPPAAGPPAAPSPPPADAILVIDGRGVPTEHFDAYVAANFDPSELEEPLAPADDARVRSRLFDDFVSEETLLAEAEARGIRVGEVEVRAWLSGEAPEEDGPQAAQRRERARRELTLRRLLDDLVLENPGKDERTIRREVASRHRVEPRPDRLPFPYRPEGS
ncbi:MAG TPA: hypothetical protein VF139_16670 [Candidatus Polarisedimenticolaceae bacterium]